MTKKKNIISQNHHIVNNNFLSNFKLFKKFNEKWDIIFNFCISYFNKNNYSKNIINIVKTIYLNKSFCIIFFLFASWFWSNLILNFFYCFMLFDSLIISLLVLQNNSIEINSRRLSKNVILIALSSMNLIQGIMTLLLVSFIYMEFNKFLGRLIFKFIKFFIKIFGNIFPPIYLLYPDIKLFNFEDPDMTICSDNKKKEKKHINFIKPSSSDSIDSSNQIDHSYLENSSNYSDCDSDSNSNNSDLNTNSYEYNKKSNKNNSTYIKISKSKNYNKKIKKSNKKNN